jgi:hypothetical protein
VFFDLHKSTERRVRRFRPPADEGAAIAAFGETWLRHPYATALMNGKHGEIVGAPPQRYAQRFIRCATRMPAAAG